MAKFAPKYAPFLRLGADENNRWMQVALAFVGEGEAEAKKVLYIRTFGTAQLYFPEIYLLVHFMYPSLCQTLYQHNSI